MKSKVSTEEDVDEFVLLNERIRSPVTHTYTHTHMYMHRNSLVALNRNYIIYKNVKRYFSLQRTTLYE